MSFFRQEVRQSSTAVASGDWKLQKLRAEASSLVAALESGMRRYGELVGVAGSGTFSKASTSRSPSNSGLTRITIDLSPSRKKSKAAGNRA